MLPTLPNAWFVQNNDLKINQNPTQKTVIQDGKPYNGPAAMERAQIMHPKIK